jgi:UDP-N-acetylglucosamine 1-carboxyvinyltransferase
LILAGLAAEGQTEVSGTIYLDRGYEDFVGKLAGVGADIRREAFSSQNSQRTTV